VNITLRKNRVQRGKVVLIFFKTRSENGKKSKEQKEQKEQKEPELSFDDYKVECGKWKRGRPQQNLIKEKKSQENRRNGTLLLLL